MFLMDNIQYFVYKSRSMNILNLILIQIRFICNKFLNKWYQINITNYFHSLKDKRTYIYYKYMQWICNINFNPF